MAGHGGCGRRPPGPANRGAHHTSRAALCVTRRAGDQSDDVAEATPSVRSRMAGAGGGEGRRGGAGGRGRGRAVLRGRGGGARGRSPARGGWGGGGKRAGAAGGGRGPGGTAGPGSR